jgi:hypothetical protein
MQVPNVLVAVVKRHMGIEDSLTKWSRHADAALIRAEEQQLEQR